MTFGARTLGYLAGGFTTGLSTTLTIGTASAGGGQSLRGFTSTIIVGYTPTTFGSLASAAITGGKTCASCYDDRDTGASLYAAVLRISGFASNPGRTYLYDVTANGVTRTEPTATAYSYVAGVALWEWEDVTTAFLFGFATSGSTSLVIRLT